VNTFVEVQQGPLNHKLTRVALETFSALHHSTSTATGISTSTQLTLASIITTSSTEGAIGSRVGISATKGTSGQLWHIL
jgi:hypothetical protein